MTPKQIVLKRYPAASVVAVFWNSWWQYVIRDGATGNDISKGSTCARMAWDSARTIIRRSKRRGGDSQP